MHELSLASELHRLCRARIRGAGAVRLTRVRIAVGELSAVEPDLLRFAWNAVISDGPDAGAALDVDWRPCRQVCDACGDLGAAKSLGWRTRCPRCGGALRIEGGLELDLEELSCEEAAPVAEIAVAHRTGEDPP